METTTVRIPIAREEDRQIIAGILVKNGMAVKGEKDYRINKDGKKGNTLQYYITIQDAEVTSW